MRHCIANAHAQTMEEQPEPTEAPESADIPVGWARVAKTDQYVRLLDCITMNLQDAIALEAPAVVKPEHYLSLPEIIKFYQERVEYCTADQAQNLITALASELQSKDPVSCKIYELNIWSGLQFGTRSTKKVTLKTRIRFHLQDITRRDISVEAHSGDVFVDEYNLETNNGQFPTFVNVLNNLGQFPTFVDVFQYVPHLYAELKNLMCTDDIYTIRNSVASYSTGFEAMVGYVQLQDSILSADMRQAIFDIDDEEAELNAKLEKLQKRKRELVNTSRNVHTRQQ